MFGSKAREILRLKDKLNRALREVEDLDRDYRAEEAVRTRAEQELSVLQEAFRNGCKITDDLKEKVAGLEQSRSGLLGALKIARDTNDDLARKNWDLEYQNGLLVTVLQQLRIPVKLPARKS